MCKGRFKAACAILRLEQDTLSRDLTSFRKIISEGIHVYPRKLFLHLPAGQEITWLERPLRAQTMQGERVALARSECAPVGTTLECEIKIPTLAATKRKAVDLAACVREWLDQSAEVGLGQWRTAGWGRMTYEVLG